VKEKSELNDLFSKFLFECASDGDCVVDAIAVLAVKNFGLIDEGKTEYFLIVHPQGTYHGNLGLLQCGIDQIKDQGDAPE
jgi:hypothetical protein